MANSIYDFLPTEANDSQTGGVNTAEGQNPSTVNDAQRNWKQLEARFIDDLGGVNTVGGTATAVTVTAAQDWDGYGSAAGQIDNGTMLALKMSTAATGAATLAVNGLTAKAIRKQGDTAIAAGDWANKGIYLFRFDTSYNGGAGAWVLLNFEAASREYADTKLSLSGGTLTGTYLVIDPGAASQYSPQIQLVNSYNGIGAGYFFFQKNRNGGPVVAGDGLGYFLWSGFNNGAYVQSSMISASVVEVGTTTVASKLQFDTSVGTNARSNKATIYAGLYMLGTVDPGVGNINAVDYYDNGVNINTLYLAVADVATSANFLANASNKVLRTTEVWSAAAYVNLGSSLSGNLTLDLATFINAYGTATGNITFNGVSNSKPQSGQIEITASGADRTVGFNTTYFCTPDNAAIADIPSGKTVTFSYVRTQSGKILLVRLGEVA